MIKNIVFDFGGVLIDWNPRYLYNQLFENKDDMEYFLSEVCNDYWNLQQDAGRPINEATKLLVLQHPQYEEMIRAYYGRWEEMLNGQIKENVDILYKIDKTKYNIYGLTNWSGETFPIAYSKYPFFKEFKGIVVSGDEKMIKPNKDIFYLLLIRYGLKAEDSLFIDDNINNVKTAKDIGFHTLHYSATVNLEQQFKNLGIL